MQSSQRPQSLKSGAGIVERCGNRGEMGHREWCENGSAMRGQKSGAELKEWCRSRRMVHAPKCDVGTNNHKVCSYIVAAG